MRSPAAASGGAGGQGLAVSLLEAFIECHQADVQRCLSLGISPATGASPGNRSTPAPVPDEDACLGAHAQLCVGAKAACHVRSKAERELGAGMLVRNYRSHASLLHIPNRLFYKDSLQASLSTCPCIPLTLLSTCLCPS